MPTPLLGCLAEVKRVLRREMRHRLRMGLLDSVWLPWLIACALGLLSGLEARKPPPPIGIESTEWDVKALSSRGKETVKTRPALQSLHRLEEKAAHSKQKDGEKSKKILPSGKLILAKSFETGDHI